MTTQRTSESLLRIAAGHPSLPGHFPGAPIVPGVVLLDAVLRAAESWLQQALPVQELAQAKFSTPLLPEQTAILQLTLQGTALRFAITREAAAIAQGLLRLAREPA